MAKFGDVDGKGRSTLIPYRRGEDPMDRHDRRLFKNLDHQAILKEWCKANHISCKITNYGHHWQFRGKSTNAKGKPVDRQADWWPSSAKMVIDRNWKKGIHVHDFRQAATVLIEKFRLSVDPPEYPS